MNRVTAVSTALNEQRRTQRQERRLNEAAGVDPANKPRRRSHSLAGWKLFLLYLCFAAYVLVGAVIFYFVENASPQRRTPPPPPPPLALALANGSTLFVPQPLVNAKGQTLIYWPKLTYVDAVYFILVNLSTIGFGDIIPTCDGGRAFVFCWSFIGISFLSLVFVQFVTKTLSDVYKRVKRRIKQKWRGRIAALTGLELSSPGFSEPASPRTAGSVPMSRKSTGAENKSFTDLAAASNTSLPSLANMTASRTNLDLSKAGLQMTASRTNLDASIYMSSSRRSLPGTLERNVTRKTMQTLAVDAADIFAQTFSALVLYLGWLLVGAAIFSHTEKHAKTINDGAPWSFGNAMYFCYIASTSIGYGSDYAPATQHGRIAFILWVQVAVFLQLLLFSNLFSLLWKQFNKKVTDRVVEKVAEIVADESATGLPTLTSDYGPPSVVSVPKARQEAREDEVKNTDVLADLEAQSHSASQQTDDSDDDDDRPIRRAGGESAFKRAIGNEDGSGRAAEAPHGSAASPASSPRELAEVTQGGDQDSSPSRSPRTSTEQRNGDHEPPPV